MITAIEASASALQRVLQWGVVLSLCVLGGILLFDAGPAIPGLSPWMVRLVGLGVLAGGLGLGIHHATASGRRISIDTEARTVTFENFHVTRAARFSLRRTRTVTLPFAEITAAEYIAGGRGPGMLYVLTSAGRVKLPDTARNFEAVRQKLEEIAARTPPPPGWRSARSGFLLVLVLSIAIPAAVVVGVATGALDALLKALAGT